MKLRACLVCGLVFVMGCAYFAKSSPPVAPKNPDLLQFRLVEEKEGPDTVAMKVMGKDETLNVNKQVLLNALDVESAKATRERHSGSPGLSLNFTRDGAKKFAEVTAKNVNRKLAIIVDGQLLSAPVIRSRVEGGKAVITGSFTMKEAQELASAINANVAR
jgi:preprotein translocase subunit SecD